MSAGKTPAVVAMANAITARCKVLVAIDSKAALDNAEEILAEADGIVISRGDLGLEVPPR